MKKNLALSLIINFARDEERDLLREGKEQDAFRIESARQMLHRALLKSIDNVSVTLDKMLNFTYDDNGMIVEDTALWASDMYTRSLLTNFRENWNNIRTTKKSLYEVRAIKLTVTCIEEYQEALHMSTPHICAGLDEVKSFCGVSKLHKRTGNYIATTNDAEFIITRLVK
jgi:hypothetical protein